MTDFNASDRDVTRAIRSWLHEDRHEDVSRIAAAVLDRVEATPRRRARWWPARRTPTLSKLVPIGLGAAAVVAVLVVGVQLFGSPSGGVGSPATPTPELTASPEPIDSPEPSTSSPPSAPPLTQSFTSTQHGISLSFPEGWTARAATEPCTESTCSDLFSDPSSDVLTDPILDEGHLYLGMYSQPIGDAAPEDWMAAQMASDERCVATEPIAVDGATGLIGGEGCNDAVVTSAGRGYRIWLNASQDDPVAVAPYDRAWFEEVLATVQLHPEDAVDSVPSASP